MPDRLWGIDPEHDGEGTGELEVICVGCRKPPEEISEYVIEAETFTADMTPEQFEANGPWTPLRFVQQEEGTYNPRNGHFACTACYIAMGQPSSPIGWVAP
jgi:hypothetical protein